MVLLNQFLLIFIGTTFSGVLPAQTENKHLYSMAKRNDKRIEAMMQPHFSQQNVNSRVRFNDLEELSGHGHHILVFLMKQKNYIRTSREANVKKRTVISLVMAENDDDEKNDESDDDGLTIVARDDDADRVDNLKFNSEQMEVLRANWKNACDKKAAKQKQNLRTAQVHPIRSGISLAISETDEEGDDSSYEGMTIETNTEDEKYAINNMTRIDAVGDDSSDDDTSYEGMTTETIAEDEKNVTNNMTGSDGEGDDSSEDGSNYEGMTIGTRAEDEKNAINNMTGSDGEVDDSSDDDSTYEDMIIETSAEDEKNALYNINFNEEQKNMLRWRGGSCSKKAVKVCNRACRNAHKHVCTIYKCKKGMRRKIKKECKRSCRRKFMSGKSKYSDSSTENDFTYERK